jgi:hypothetical protein
MVRQVAVILLSALAFEAHANGIFRWVDDRGKVHYGGAVPEKYRYRAKKLESENADDLKARREEAEARLARDKAGGDARRPPKGEADAAKPAAVPPKPAAAPGPVGSVSSFDPACAEIWNQYLASVQCFANFVNRNGSVRPEAYKNCTTLNQPHECTRPPERSDR